ncbi:mechanosensitive ion channel family protein [Sinobaca sp. H24]|uniref:mechanosensitive ion channel family protein n=1 Tax=Sinobaca sp. H24 TaxID=2923376 RepID=UPI0020799711|nr:mechanosensitive ion channel family protein [Sinobaca sp. H24]
MPGFIDETILTGVLSAALLVAIQIILAIIGYFIARAVGKRIIIRGFSKMQEKRNMHPGRIKTISRLLVNVFSYVLIFVLITIILGIFNLPIASLIAGAGVVGLAVGFGAQGLVSDVVTGVFLLIEKQVDVDDYISVAGLDGVVEEIGLRTTQIRSFDGVLHFIPNREIITVSNYSRGNMQALIDIGISYNDDIDKATSVLQEACNKVASIYPEIVEGPDVVGVQSLGDSEVVLRIIGKTENMMQWAMQREILKACKEALEENGIEIPYPHQVYIDKHESVSVNK